MITCKLKILLKSMILFLLLITISSCNKENDIKIIKTFDELGRSIEDAKDGDILYVDNISFSPKSKDEFITNNQKELKKNITIKGVNEEGTLFENGMFLISGSKIQNRIINISFDNIIFDYKIDVSSLTAETLPDDGYYSNAISFFGNINCNFSNCIFKNYFGYDGSVFEIRYADYTNNEFLSPLYKDQSNCTLNITLDNCQFIGNGALFSGGVLYAEGNDNVVFNINECMFSGNKCGAFYGNGGGAIYADGVTLNISKTMLDDNKANYCYPLLENYYPLDGLSEPRGGAMHVINSNLKATQTTISNNVAAIGGGISLTSTTAEFDGCIFTKNNATKCDLQGDFSMPCSIGRGGALYIDGNNAKKTLVINSEIYDNSALIAYGGIFRYYDGIQDITVDCYLDIVLSTYFNNKCETTYDYNQENLLYWNNVPGDIWLDPNTSVIASLIIDDSFNSIFPKNILPSKDNSYSYFSSQDRLEENGIKLNLDTKNQNYKLSYDNKNDYKVDKLVVANYIDGRYNGKLNSVYVGSNNIDDLYQNSENNYLIIYIASIIILGMVISTLIYLKLKKKKRKVGSFECETTRDDDNHISSQKYIIMRFTEEQIEKIITSLPEVQLLTNRELEVFKEMLHGKKQIEIAEILFISTSTVKDFYQKIYKKMDVDSKDSLFKKVYEEFSKVH